jgi:hypothetical protein
MRFLLVCVLLLALAGCASSRKESSARGFGTPRGDMDSADRDFFIGSFFGDGRD